eukprot:2878163-Rhodomonas_salina.3
MSAHRARHLLDPCSTTTSVTFTTLSQDRAAFQACLTEFAANLVGQLRVGKTCTSTSCRGVNVAAVGTTAALLQVHS